MGIGGLEEHGEHSKVGFAAKWMVLYRGDNRVECEVDRRPAPEFKNTKSF